MTTQTTAPKRLSNEYAKAFPAWLRNPSGSAKTAITYEGLDSAGGAAIPVTVDQNIVGLAPADSAVRRLARVITTTRDVVIPFETATGVPAKKPESGPTLSPFVNTSGTISGTRMRAHMIGAENDVSFELLDDAPLFASFVVGSMERSQQAVEEFLYISGSGIGEPQGILGNVGAGVTEELDAAGNLVTVAGLFNLIATLKSDYHSTAAFIMRRSTATVIRKAEIGVLGPALFTSVDGQERLLGYPVEYSDAMPIAARGATPIIFGSVKRGYLVADRDDSTLKVKVLDQDPTKALAGVLSLLTYRRGEGRVCQPEAIQQYNIAAS